MCSSTNHRLVAGPQHICVRDWCSVTVTARDRLHVIDATREHRHDTDRTEGPDYDCQMANSFDLQEELQALQDIGNYPIEHEHAISSMEPAEMDRLLQRAPLAILPLPLGPGLARSLTSITTEAVSAIAESSDAVTSPDTFDVLRSFLKSAGSVPGILMSKLLDVVMSGFAAEVDSAAHDVDHEDQRTCSAAHKVPIEMYAFLLNWSARSADKVVLRDEDASAPITAKPRKGRGGKPTQSRTAAKNKTSEWSWKDQIVPILTLISKVLKLKTSKIWTVSGERDTFIGCVGITSRRKTRCLTMRLSCHIAGVSLRLRITSRRTSST